MKSYDVVVVGGGPAGAVAARHATVVGARVLLIEQGDGSGEPARCTGLVSPRTLDLLGASTTSVLREIRGGTLHAPGGRTLNIRAETVKAVVLDRGRLNRELIELAASAGAEVRTHTRAVAATTGRVWTKHQGNKEELKTAVIIGADGPQSAIASWFSLPHPTQLLVASQVVVTEDHLTPDGIEVFFG
ncbi:FAD-dependent monooxygenase, partial [Candidatus Bipolaricaulota bacterium]|nr:FAD-dependent monooxygenase [Candidatus Bipolaricaulota bacterium]